MPRRRSWIPARSTNWLGAKRKGFSAEFAFPCLSYVTSVTGLCPIKWGHHLWGGYVPRRATTRERICSPPPHSLLHGAQLLLGWGWWICRRSAFLSLVLGILHSLAWPQLTTNLNVMLNIEVGYCHLLSTFFVGECINKAWVSVCS